MARMRVAQVSRPNGPLELVEREIAEAYERTMSGRARFRVVVEMAT